MFKRLLGRLFSAPDAATKPEYVPVEVRLRTLQDNLAGFKPAAILPRPNNYLIKVQCEQHQQAIRDWMANERSNTEQFALLRPLVLTHHLLKSSYFDDINPEWACIDGMKLQFIKVFNLQETCVGYVAPKDVIRYWPIVQALENRRRICIAAAKVTAGAGQEPMEIYLSIDEPNSVAAEFGVPYGLRPD